MSVKIILRTQITSHHWIAYPTCRNVWNRKSASSLRVNIVENGSTIYPSPHLKTATPAINPDGIGSICVFDKKYLSSEFLFCPLERHFDCGSFKLIDVPQSVAIFSGRMSKKIAYIGNSLSRERFPKRGRIALAFLAENWQNPFFDRIFHALTGPSGQSKRHAPSTRRSPTSM